MFFEVFSRYEQVPPPLLKNEEFSLGLQGWVVQGGEKFAKISNKILTVTNRDPLRSVSIFQIVPMTTNNKLWLLSASVSTENVMPGAKPWHQARIIIFGRSAEKKSLARGIKHILVAIKGSSPWRKYASIFRIPASSTDVVVKIQLSNATGILHVKDLQLILVKERTAFKLLAYMLLTAWVIALAWIGHLFLIGVKFTAGNAAIAVVCMAIAAGALMSGFIKQEVYELVWNFLISIYQAIFGGDENLNWELLKNLPVDFGKFGHFALFFILGLVIRLVRQEDKILSQFLILLLFGAVIEVLQYFSIDRHPSLRDFTFDVGGIVLAYIFIVILYGKTNRFSG